MTNVSTFGHELAVIRTALLTNALPQTAGTGRVNETGLDVVGRITVAGGATISTSMNPTPGTYALICNLPRGTTNGHYASGVFSQFEVRAGGAALGNIAPLPAPAPAAAAVPAAPKTGSAGMLVSDVATGGLLALLLVTLVLVAGGRAVVGQAR